VQPFVDLVAISLHCRPTEWSIVDLYRSEGVIDTVVVYTANS